MLFRKLLRDIRRHFFQFLSVFLMTFLSIHFYTGITQEWKGLRNNVDKYYDMTNLADYFLYSDESFSKEDLEKILKMDKVSDAERTLVFETKANLEGNPNIKLHVMEKGAITKPYLVSGEEFNATGEFPAAEAYYASAISILRLLPQVRTSYCKEFRYLQLHDPILKRNWLQL